MTDGTRPPASASKRPTLMVLTHSFAPDPAAVGQYMSDVARSMAARGARVIVYTARNGYDDPSVVYPKRELVDGVEVRRIAFASFGKGSLLKRAAAAGWFIAYCFAAAVTTRKVSGLLVSTAPPLIGAVAWAMARLRRIPYAYWAMDLNPDQLIALGHLPDDNPIAKLLAAVDRAVVREASIVIALDRYMGERLKTRGKLKGEVKVIAPWSRDPAPMNGRRKDNPFRLEQGWGDKIVFLYSGNHTTSNPLSTLLESAKRLKGRSDLHFVFIGSGQSKKEVERLAANGAGKIMSLLPYQPFERLSVTLPAGDVHIASLGEGMVGIVHPCKVYSAMAAGRPVLYLGPSPSHISELIDRYEIGWHVRHDDIDGVTATIERIASIPAEVLAEKGRRGQLAVKSEFSRDTLCPLLCDELTRVLFSSEFRPGR